MNISILNHYALPPDRAGGTRHYDLARELLKAGHHTTIYASSFDHWTKRDERLLAGERFRTEAYNGVTFVWVRTCPYQDNSVGRLANMLSYAWRVGRVAREIGDTPDVVVGSTVHPFAGWAGYWIARARRVPFVFEVRDPWPQTLIDMGVLSPRHPIVFLMRWLEGFLYRRAERIVSVFPYVAYYTDRFGVAPEKVEWISNGVPVNIYQVDNYTSSECGGPFTIMYLGVHGPANGLDNVLHAAAILQSNHTGLPIEFHLVGSGLAKPDLLALAEQLALKNVHFLDPVPKQQIPKVASQADAFIFNVIDALPVLEYGLSSNKLFDYMAAGRPVLSCCVAKRNPIAEAQAGFVIPPRQPELLAEAVVQLYQLPAAERRAMGLRGRAYVLKYHNIELLGQQFARLLETLNAHH